MKSNLSVMNTLRKADVDTILYPNVNILSIKDYLREARLYSRIVKILCNKFKLIEITSSTLVIPKCVGT